ncbi:MAG: DNA polymerase I [Lachnospiraceae bacterium]|nr:DNA polymerase I [Lachnospiraceae bacterium]MBQ3973632.1 DNA polymerase I [Lachnospiraceae bacterium]MBQ4305215.1 DNA polymerase I [Lachnospiraceae bacterium]MBQ5361637.1 DNA polymerase I [Lachnospiraceae bacterium]
MDKKKLVLIDGHSILNRAFYGMPDLTNSKGVHTGAVYGFLNIMLKLVEEEKADYLTVAFDVHAPTFRHDFYKEYKGTRKPMPEELRQQVPLMKEVLHAMGIATCEKAGLEADDILGTLARKAEAKGMEVALVSGDRDLLQIASEHICIRIPRTRQGQTTVDSFHASDVLEKLQVTPAQFIDVKALMGDSSDNVPGVPKVGEKTATQLIVEYGSLDGVYENLEKIKKPALKKNLSENEDLARKSRFLVTIKTDCDLELDEEKAAVGNFYTPEAFKIFTELNFKNLLTRFDTGTLEKKEEKEKKEIRILREKGSFTAWAEGFSGRVLSDGAATAGFFPVFDPVRFGTGQDQEVTGAAVCDSEGIYYFCGESLVSDLGQGLALIRSSLVKSAAEKGEETSFIVSFGLKRQYPFWQIDRDSFAGGIRLEGLLDLQIMAYLVNPLKNDYEPEEVITEYAGGALETRKQIFGKMTWKEAASGKEEALTGYACRLAEGFYKAGEKVLHKLKEDQMWDLYRTMERPLTYVLYDMERIGVRINREALKEYSAKLEGRIGELEASIYQATGQIFNIASPKQLGQILFEEMGLPGGKKTKTGYSTAADVLEKLAPDYPVVADILEYRGLTKLKSTYADGLTAYITPDQRIHTTLNQTITATGRISSTDPNLQNIPMKTELGRQIRKAFIPADGQTFTDADYSQIELRILAHMSGDKELIEAYRENKDIHAITASKVFHVPFDQVTSIQRRNAKAVNFGIVYGISSFGLSQGLSISRKEAAEYIEAYFKTYPGIKAFLDGLVKSARETGYALTMFGRRRPVPELKSSNFMQRSFGERVAMNSPIQGSGADIMKAAMISVWEEIRKRNLKSELILQIHDELLVETAPGEEETVKNLLEEKMKAAASLRVSLETDVHAGTDWYEAK